MNIDDTNVGHTQLVIVRDYNYEPFNENANLCLHFGISLVLSKL